MDTPMEKLGSILKRTKLNKKPTLKRNDLKTVSVNPFECPICKGDKWVYPRNKDRSIDYSHVVSCICQKPRIEQEKREHLLRFCKLPPNTEHMTFDNFKVNGNSSLKEAFELAQSLNPDNNNLKWLTLLGRVDRGKTHLAIAVCKKWLDKGVPARYAFVPMLLKELREGFEQEGEQSYNFRFDQLCKIPLLVLDDLGAEKTTDWGKEQLMTIIHYRGLNSLHLIVTTNRALNEIVGKDSDGSYLASQRIASRLQRESWCKAVMIDAPEHRSIEKLEGA